MDERVAGAEVVAHEAVADSGLLRDGAIGEATHAVAVEHAHRRGQQRRAALPVSRCAA